MPPHVIKYQKEKLLCASFHDQNLFDPASVARVIGEVQKDSNTSAQLAFTKVVSLPSFAAARAAVR